MPPGNAESSAHSRARERDAFRLYHYTVYTSVVESTHNCAPHGTIHGFSLISFFVVTTTPDSAPVESKPPMSALPLRTSDRCMGSYLTLARSPPAPALVPNTEPSKPDLRRQAAAATAVAASATKEGVALLHACGAVKWLCRISGDVG